MPPLNWNCVWQASDVALANAAQLVRDAQVRLTVTEENLRAARSECARLQGAFEAAHDSYGAVVASAAKERERLTDGHGKQVEDFHQHAKQQEVILRKQVEECEAEMKDVRQRAKHTGEAHVRALALRDKALQQRDTQGRVATLLGDCRFHR